MYKIAFTISVLLVLVSIVVVAVFGLNLNADFKGGSLLEIEFLGEKPTAEKIKSSLEGLELGEFSLVKTGENGFLFKFKEISEETHQKIISRIKNGIGANFEEKQFDSIGPSLGKELRKKSITAIIIALVLISIYLTIVFRKLSLILNPWILGFATLVALLHDLLIPAGIFSILGRFKGIEIDPPMIAAALAILGYSVNDNVVIFDRIRENYLKYGGNFNEIVHKSIKQILSRSINTTLTTLLVVVAIYFFGGETLKNFSLALLVGISLGAYSSIFVATPILMFLRKSRR